MCLCVYRIGSRLASKYVLDQICLESILSFSKFVVLHAHYNCHVTSQTIDLNFEQPFLCDQINFSFKKIQIW